MDKPTKYLIATLSLAFSVGPITVASAAPGEHVQRTQAFDKSMAPVLGSYLEVQQALAADTMKGVQEAAKRIAKASRTLDSVSATGKHAAHYKNLPSRIETAATLLSQAKDIEQARRALRKLSMPMAMWATMSKPTGIDVVFCSMAKGSWLQKQGTVANPYYGADMLTCGEVVGGANHSAAHAGHKH